MTPSSATTPTTVSHGWRVTRLTYQAPCSSWRSSSPTVRVETSPAVANPALRQARRPTTRVPMNRRIAGLTVIATSTVTATVPAATRPISARIGMPDRTSAPRAMTTVAPAKTTALPAVATDRAIDSRRSIPCRMLPRCRLTMNSA